MEPTALPGPFASTPDDLRTVLGLPLDVLSSILALCAFRPVMRAAALVCKRFRIAAMRRVRHVSLPAQASLDDAAILLRCTPHLTHLRFREFRQPAAPISFPQSLRTLSLLRLSDGQPSPAEAAVLMTLATSLTDLELAVNASALGALTDFLIACTSLTRLSVAPPPRAANDAFFCLRVLDARWPHLTSLNVEGLRAGQELLSSRSVPHFASRLKSLRVEGLDPETLVKSLSRTRYTALTALDLGATVVPPALLLPLVSSFRAGLRLRLCIDAVSFAGNSAAYLPLSPYLTEVLLSATKDLQGLITSLHTSFPRLECVPNALALDGVRLAHFCQTPPAQHLLRSVSLETHHAETTDLSPLAALSSLTHLRYRDHTYRKAPSCLPQHPALRALELRGNVPCDFDASVRTLLPSLRVLTLRFPATRETESSLLASLPALAHLERLVVPAWFYYAPAVAACRRGWCNVCCDSDDPQA